MFQTYNSSFAVLNYEISEQATQPKLPPVSLSFSKSGETSPLLLQSAAHFYIRAIDRSYVVHS
jgi:hypothetical protein